MSYDKYNHEQLLEAIEGVTVDIGDVSVDMDETNARLTTANATLSGIATSATSTASNTATTNTNLTTVVYGKYTGTVKTTNVTVSGQAPTKLPATALASRRDYLVMNISSTTLWVGGSDVTAANGIPVISGTVFSVPLGSAELYGITSVPGITTSNIRVMEIS